MPAGSQARAHAQGERPEPGAIARSLARFAARTPGEAIPPHVRRRARHHILDAVGLAFASSREEFARKGFEGLETIAAAGEVPVLGFSARWSPRDAALINGLLCHGLDFDDTHMRGIVHPTVAQFPAALSAAIMAGADTAEMVTAYIIGVEAAARLASVAHGALHRIGFHPTGVCNAPAAALAAGRLLGLDERQLAHAQGIAVSMASGTLEFLEDGAWTKRMHPGWAASAGLTAAAMARAGYVGPASPYSGRFGLFRAYLGGDDADCDYAAATAGLGEEWELLQTAIKPYPACHLAHGCIDAAIALARSGKVRPQEIASVTALVAQEMVPTICEPLDRKRRPESGYEAQFSIPFLVATALVKGRVTLADIEGSELRNPAILALAARVGYGVDPGSGYPRHYSGEVIVETGDGGRIAERVQVNSGAPDAPVPDEEIVAKFMANAGMALPPAAAARLRDVVLAADERAPAREWAAGLQAGE